MARDGDLAREEVLASQERSLGAAGMYTEPGADRGESLPQPGTDSGRSCASRSILEPEARPEAVSKRYRQLGCCFAGY